MVRFKKGRVTGRVDGGERRSEIRERRRIVLMVELGWWHMPPRDSSTWEVKVGGQKVEGQPGYQYPVLPGSDPPHHETWNFKLETGEEG